MIRHVVAWKLNETEETAKQRDLVTIRGALAALPALISDIKALSVGPDVGNAGSNWDISLVADYDDLEGLEAYQVHPEHQKVVAIITPLVAERATVDFEL